MENSQSRPFYHSNRWSNEITKKKLRVGYYNLAIVELTEGIAAYDLIIYVWHKWPATQFRNSV